MQRNLTNYEAVSYVDRQMDTHEAEIVDSAEFWLIRGMASAIKEACERRREGQRVSLAVSTALDAFDDILADLEEKAA